ncbi:TPR repeat region-containing protein [Mycobacterium sp. MMS18-G62]
MSVVDGFLTTWSNARQTFGEGSPQTGDQYDKSATFTQLQSTVQTAAPGSKWSGGAANAYDAVNTQHGQVLGKLAGLDQRLAAEVDNSAQVVSAGRQNLDSLKQWFVDAVNSVPPGKNADQVKMQIAQKGLTQLQEIIKQSNGQSNEIGNRVRNIGDEYQALKEKLFKQGGGKGDKDGPQSATGDQQMGPVPPEQQAKEDVEKTLKTGDKEAAGRVDKVLSSIQPYHELSAEQAAYLNEMQKQQHGMSVADLKAAEGRLDASQKHLIGDSWQLMSNDDVPREAGPWDDKRETKGGFDRLPPSVQEAVKGHGAIGLPELNDVSAIVKDGNPALQQGTELDRELIRRADRIMDTDVFTKGSVFAPGEKFGEVDDAVTNIFDSAGRDHQIVHDQITGNHGDDGRDFMRDIATHEWKDDGKSAGALFDWTANSTGPEGQIAAETANTYAKFLGEESDQLLAINGHTQIGDMNPELVKAYSHGLLPYQEELFTDQPRHDTPFKGFDDPYGDMTKTKGLFAVIDSQHDAAKEWNQLAYRNAMEYQQSFAEYAKDHPTLTAGDGRVDDLEVSARVLGVIDGGINQETLSNINNAHLANQDAANAAKDAYEFKKDIIRSVFSYGPGGDLVTNTLADQLAGDPPKVEDIVTKDGKVTDVGLSTTQQSAGHQIIQAQYTIASQFVDPSNSHIDARFFENGKLLPPARIDPSDLSIYSNQVGAALVDRPYVADRLGAFRDALQRIGGYHQ